MPRLSKRLSIRPNPAISLIWGIPGIIGPISARCGVARVLTSGGQPTAALGAAVLRRLVSAAAEAGYPIVIAAGGGVSDANAAALLREAGVPELHGSARDAVRSGMRHRPEPAVHMGGEKRNGPDSEFEWRCTSAAKVADIVGAMRTL